MSSFGKNIIPRRAHKERSQPASRISKHGLLEKKKDYKQRARNQNRKKLRLKLLQEKASFRNPDEFYYGMIRSATNQGRVKRVLNEAEKNAIPLEQRSRDERMLAETQDAGYVGMKAALESARVQKIKKGLHFVGAAASMKRTHVVFVDDEKEMEQYAANVEQKETGIDEGDMDMYHEMCSKVGRRASRVMRKEGRRAYKELEQRVGRHEKLKTVLQDLGTEKALLAKGRRFLERRGNPETGEPAVYRWRQERKR